MSSEAKEKVGLCLSRYSDPGTFSANFMPATTNMYLDTAGREGMITNEVAPTLTIAKMAFGVETVKTLIKTHLFELSKAMGVSASSDTFDYIAEDVIYGYPHLKITEIILAIRMMREGKFREGRDGSGNRANMYGTISSEVVCDCLNRFCYDYRNQILDKYEHERHLQEVKSWESSMASEDVRNMILAASYITNQESTNTLLSMVPVNNESVQKVVDEFKMLRLLKSRVEEFLMTTNESSPEIDALRKGVTYINNNFNN